MKNIDIGDLFSGAFKGRGQVLNYLWLPNEADRDIENPLPDRYARNIRRIAKDNPDTDVCLWVDRQLHTRDALRALDKFGRRAGVRVKDLQDVDVYTQTPLFRQARVPALDHPLWLKVDLARIAVVEHVLRTTRADRVFYSDLDIADPQLSQPRTQEIMQKYGVVLARDDRQRVSPDHHPVENQYMGFSRAQASFVTDTLLPETARSVLERGENGYTRFNRCVSDRFKGVDPGLNDMTIRTKEFEPENAERLKNAFGPDTDHVAEREAREKRLAEKRQRGRTGLRKAVDAIAGVLRR